MKRFLIVLGLLLPSFLLHAATPQEALLANIKQAKAELARTEKAITKERIALGNTLRTLEQNVIALRNETAVARRKMDERTLGLQQLEERLATWQTQQDFQRNLLDRFLLQNGAVYSTLESLTLSEKVSQVGESTTLIQQRLQPKWHDQSLVLPNGEVTQASTLRIGPVTWFVEPDKQVSGYAGKQKNLLVAASVDSGERYEQLLELKSHQQGDIAFDPTLGRAITKSEASESVIEHVVKGGIWVVPIVLFAFIATAIGLYKVTQLWRLPAIIAVNSYNQLRATLSANGANAFKGMQKQLLDISHKAGSSKERDDELFVQLQGQKSQLDKWINTVAITAAVAPLLGLLGTVSGMIETFRMMTAFGSSDPEVISGGIAKALVTTELGLVVAIPALILNAVLSRKAKSYYEKLENFALLLSNDNTEQASNDAEIAKVESAQSAGATS